MLNDREIIAALRRLGVPAGYLEDEARVWLDSNMPRLIPVSLEEALVYRKPVMVGASLFAKGGERANPFLSFVLQSAPRAVIAASSGGSGYSKVYLVSVTDDPAEWIRPHPKFKMLIARHRDSFVVAAPLWTFEENGGSEGPGQPGMV